MGSEMCIRDSHQDVPLILEMLTGHERRGKAYRVRQVFIVRCRFCLLYTSDAADERSSVDLGGRRIIKKKKTEHTAHCYYNSYSDKSDDMLRRALYEDYIM